MRPPSGRGGAGGKAAERPAAARTQNYAEGQGLQGKGFSSL
jgi:hypothetical protein